MTAKQMVETVHEHFPNKGGRRVLMDLNTELKRYAEDVRAWHGRVSLFNQQLITDDGQDIATHAGELVQAEQYGSSFQFPNEVFIVRDKRVTGDFIVDVNERLISLFQDHYLLTLLELTEANRDSYDVTLDCVLYHRTLSYDDETELGTHGDAVVAGVLASYYGAVGNFASAKYWKGEAREMRRKAKEANTTNGAYGTYAPGLLTPPKDRR